MDCSVKQQAERIQQRAWTDQYAAAPHDFVEATGLQVIPLAEGVAQFLLRQ